MTSFLLTMRAIAELFALVVFIAAVLLLADAQAVGALFPV